MFQTVEGTGICPVCKMKIDGEGVACPRCGADHHIDCWQYAVIDDGKTCSIYGCGAVPKPKPKIEVFDISSSPQTERRKFWVVLVDVCLLGILVFCGVLLWMSDSDVNHRRDTPRPQPSEEVAYAESLSVPFSIELPDHKKAWVVVSLNYELPRDRWQMERIRDRCISGRISLSGLIGVIIAEAVHKAMDCAIHNNYRGYSSCLESHVSLRAGLALEFLGIKNNCWEIVVKEY